MERDHLTITVLISFIIVESFAEFCLASDYIEFRWIIYNFVLYLLFFIFLSLRTSEKLLVSEAFQNVLNPNTANPIFLYKLKAYRTVDVKTLSFYMKQELRPQEKNK